MRRGRGPRGRGRGAGQCGAGAERLRPRFGPSVSSRAGARAGHGGLCGPAGLGRGQPLVVPLANWGPRAEVALCGGWSWGLPTSGDHDDAEAPLVPVRDGARGPYVEPRERVPASEEARRPGRLRVIGVRPGRGSRPGADLFCLGCVPGTEKGARPRALGYAGLALRGS